MDNKPTLATLRTQPHMSASQLSSFLSCSLQHKFRYIDNIPSKSKSSSLIQGSAVHQVMEHFYNALKEGEILSADELLELYELRLRWLCSNSGEISFKDGEDYQSLLAQGKGLIKCFADNLEIDPAMKVLYVEEAFSIDIPGVPVPVIGAIDLVLESEDSIIIVDHKTAGRGMSSADIDLLDALCTYQMSIKDRGHGDKEILLRLDCLIKTKTPRFEQYWTSRSELDEQRLVKKFQTAWAAIESGNFIPNDGNWKCTTCSYQQECKDWSNCDMAA